MSQTSTAQIATINPKEDFLPVMMFHQKDKSGFENRVWILRCHNPGVCLNFFLDSSTNFSLSEEEFAKFEDCLDEQTRIILERIKEMSPAEFTPGYTEHPNSRPTDLIFQAHQTVGVSSEIVIMARQEFVQVGNENPKLN